jgi:hypothetical protein
LGRAQAAATSKATDNTSAIQGAPLSTKPMSPKTQKMVVRMGALMVGRVNALAAISITATMAKRAASADVCAGLSTP